MKTLTPIKKNKQVKSKVIQYPIYEGKDGNYDTISTTDLNSIIQTSKDIIEDNGDTRFDIKIKLSENKIANINFNLVEHEFCCGVIDIGNLNSTGNTPIKELTKILDNFASNNKGKTYTAYTSTSESNKRYALAFAGCAYWTLVKTWKNSNTGNEIKMWVSNND